MGTGFADRLPHLNRAPVVPEHVHRIRSRHGVGNRHEVVGKLLEPHLGDRSLVGGGTVTARVVRDHPKAVGKERNHRIPETVGVGPSMHEHERGRVRAGGVRLAVVVDRQLGAVDAHGEPRGRGGCSFDGHHHSSRCYRRYA